MFSRSVESRFLSLITYEDALVAQAAVFGPCLFGFEARPVVTMGLRARAEDLIRPLKGYSILSVDRGGQATIHNPGQLVIFPALPVAGVRAFVQKLADTTVRCLQTFNIESTWRDDQPGLFTSKGKIMACGIRVRRGWCTHGIAINVCNDLEPFQNIRACGMAGAAVDRIGGVEPREVFARWCEAFA